MIEIFLTHFSLNEEARNTERHHIWNSDQKSRHCRVAFVSAGTTNPAELRSNFQRKSDSTGGPSQIIPDRLSSAALNEQKAASHVTPTVEMVILSLEGNSHQQNLESESKSTEVAHLKGMLESIELKQLQSDTGRDIFFDHSRAFDESTQASFQYPIVTRSPSPTASISSDEVILFAGRKVFHREKARGAKALLQLPCQSDRRGHLPRSAPQVIEDPIAPDNSYLLLESTCSLDHMPLAASKTNPERMSGTLNGTSKSAPTIIKPVKRRSLSTKATKETEILDDYVSNVRDNAGTSDSSKNSTATLHDLNGSEVEKWQDEQKTSLNAAEEWYSADLRDLKDLSISQGSIDVVDRVFAKRERKSGSQYLVTKEGYTTSEARWLPLSALNTSSAKKKIRFNEKPDSERFTISSDSSDEKSSILQFALRDVFEDELVSVETLKQGMTDEQIVRSLSKQEELGLGSSDLVLFDGAEVDEVQIDSTSELAAKLNTRRSSRVEKAPKITFSSSVFADTADQGLYNTLDVRHQDRYQLRKKTKGRRAKLSVEMSDSELEHSLQAAWKNDRIKKKIRKQQREELRVQGLLGRKNKVDLNVKYAKGMSIHEVKNEINDFLGSSMERYKNQKLRICRLLMKL